MKATDPNYSRFFSIALSIILSLGLSNTANAGKSASGAAPSDTDVLSSLYKVAEKIRYGFRSTNRGCEWGRTEEEHKELGRKRAEF